MLLAAFSVGLLTLFSPLLWGAESTPAEEKMGYSPASAYPDPLGPSNPYLYPTSPNRYKYYRLVLTRGNCQPDNYPQECYLINGQFPGPPIIVDQYDFVEVTVVNHLPVLTAIHFHGILQLETVNADGVPYVTQDPIPPNGTYVYQIQVEGQTGTYMYHGHNDLDLVWLHGPFIIRDNPALWAALGPAYHFDGGHERVFQLEAVFHQPLAELIQEILGKGNDDPTIASLAINGHSYGQWGNGRQNGNAPGYQVVTATPGKKYRFRIINISAGAFFRFEIGGHPLEIIEADGIVIEPVVTSYLEINSGQRYSVLVTMNQTVSNYWISCTLMAGDEEDGPGNGKAILHYQGASDPAHLRKKLFMTPTPGITPTANDWVLSQIRPNLKYLGHQAYPLPLKYPARNIFIDMHFRTTEGAPRFLINGHQLQPLNSTYLTRVRRGEDISQGNPHVFKIYQDDVINLIFQNRVDDTGGCDEHPIHLHGHAFWVLLSGSNTLDRTKLPRYLAEAAAKGNNHQFRDVFTLYPNQSPENDTSGAGCGWAVIRFKANNPGLWLVHCHITSHMMLGKMFTLWEFNPANPRLINE